MSEVSVDHAYAHAEHSQHSPQCTLQRLSMQNELLINEKENVLKSDDLAIGRNSLGESCVDKPCSSVDLDKDKSASLSASRNSLPSSEGEDHVEIIVVGGSETRDVAGILAGGASPFVYHQQSILQNFTQPQTQTPTLVHTPTSKPTSTTVTTASANSQYQQQQQALASLTNTFTNSAVATAAVLTSSSSVLPRPSAVAFTNNTSVQNRPSFVSAGGNNGGTPKIPMGRLSTKLNHTTPLRNPSSSSRRQTTTGGMKATTSALSTSQNTPHRRPGMSLTDTLPAGSSSKALGTYGPSLTTGQAWNLEESNHNLPLPSAAGFARRASTNVEVPPLPLNTLLTPSRPRTASVAPHTQRTSQTARKRESLALMGNGANPASTRHRRHVSVSSSHNYLSSYTSSQNLPLQQQQQQQLLQTPNESKAEELWTKLRNHSMELSRLHRCYLETLTKIEELSGDSKPTEQAHEDATQMIAPQTRSKFEFIREHVVALHPAIALISSAHSAGAMNDELTKLDSTCGKTGSLDMVTQHRRDHIDLESDGIAKYFDVKHVPLPVVSGIPTSSSVTLNVDLQANIDSKIEQAQPLLASPVTSRGHNRRPTATVFCETFSANMNSAAALSPYSIQHVPAPACSPNEQSRELSPAISRIHSRAPSQQISVQITPHSTDRTSHVSLSRPFLNDTTSPARGGANRSGSHSRHVSLSAFPGVAESTHDSQIESLDTTIRHLDFEDEVVAYKEPSPQPNQDLQTFSVDVDDNEKIISEATRLQNLNGPLISQNQSENVNTTALNKNPSLLSSLVTTVTTPSRQSRTMQRSNALQLETTQAADAVFSKIFSESARTSTRQSIVTVNGIVEKEAEGYGRGSKSIGEDDSQSPDLNNEHGVSGNANDNHTSPIRKTHAPESGKLSALRKQHRAAFVGLSQPLGQGPVAQVQVQVQNQQTPNVPSLNFTTRANSDEQVSGFSINKPYMPQNSSARKGLFSQNLAVSQMGTVSSLAAGDTKSKVISQIATLLSELVKQPADRTRSNMTSSLKVNEVGEAIYDTLIRQGLIQNVPSANGLPTPRKHHIPKSNSAESAKIQPPSKANLVSNATRRAAMNAAIAAEAVASLAIFDQDDVESSPIGFSGLLSSDEEEDNDDTVQSSSSSVLANMLTSTRSMSSWQDVFAQEQAKVMKQHTIQQQPQQQQQQQQDQQQAHLMQDIVSLTHNAHVSGDASCESGASAVKLPSTQSIIQHNGVPARKPIAGNSTKMTPRRPINARNMITPTGMSKLIPKASPNPTTSKKLGAKSASSLHNSVLQGRPSLSKNGQCHVAGDKKSVVYVTPGGQRVQGALVFVLDDNAEGSSKVETKEAPVSLTNSVGDVNTSSNEVVTTNIERFEREEESSAPMPKPLALSFDIVESALEDDEIELTPQSANERRDKMLRAEIPIESKITASPSLGPNTGFYIRQDDGSMVPVIPDQLTIETLGVSIENDMLELDDIDEGSEENSDFESPSAIQERLGDVSMLSDIEIITPRNNAEENQNMKKKKKKQGAGSRPSLMVQRLSVGGGVCPMVLCTASGAPVSIDKADFVAEAMAHVLQNQKRESLSKQNPDASGSQSALENINATPTRLISLQGADVVIQSISFDYEDAEEMLRLEDANGEVLIGEDAAKAAAIARGPIADYYSDTEDEEAGEEVLDSMGRRPFKAKPHYFQPWRMDACVSETPYYEQLVTLDADSAMSVAQVEQMIMGNDIEQEAAQMTITNLSAEQDELQVQYPELDANSYVFKPLSPKEAMPSPSQLAKLTLLLNIRENFDEGQAAPKIALQRMNEILNSMTQTTSPATNLAPRQIQWDPFAVHNEMTDDDESELDDGDEGWDMVERNTQPIDLLDWNSLTGQGQVQSDSIVQMLSPLRPKNSQLTSSFEVDLEPPQLIPSQAEPCSPIPTLGWIADGTSRAEYEAKLGINDSDKRDMQSGRAAQAQAKKKRQERGIHDLPFAPAARSALLGARISLPGAVAESERYLLAQWLSLLMKKCSTLAWKVRAAKPLSQQVSSALSTPLPVYALVFNEELKQTSAVQATICLSVDTMPNVKIQLLSRRKTRSFIFPLPHLVNVDVCDLKKTSDADKEIIAEEILLGNQLELSASDMRSTGENVQRLLSRSLTFCFEVGVDPEMNADSQFLESESFMDDFSDEEDEDQKEDSEDNEESGSNEGKERTRDKKDENLLVDLETQQSAPNDMNRIAGLRVIFASRLLAKIWSSAVYLC